MKFIVEVLLGAMLIVVGSLSFAHLYNTYGPAIAAECARFIRVL